MSSASELTNKIINQLYKDGAYAWRQNTGGVFDIRRGIYRTGAKKGISDILCCHRGRFIAIEVKIGKDRMSPEQIGFMKNIMQVGGLAFIAKDFEMFLEWWKGVLATCGVKDLRTCG